MAFYIHLGPFSRRVIAEIDGRIAAEDEALSVLPAAGAKVASTASVAAAAPL
jgi:hypothetical protein